MYRQFVTLFGTRALVLMTLMLGWASAVQAAAVVTLKGEATDVKNASDAELRLSLLGFNDVDEDKAFTDAWRQWESDRDAGAFTEFLNTQETRGYLFTRAATGYTVKYAWRDPASGNRMVLLVTPALKSRNPYLWKTPNEGTEPFTVIELRQNDEEFIMKTSLEGKAVLNAQMGHLELEDFENTGSFATLRDDTPYYLKNS